MPQPLVLVLMGVSGSGKTTVARTLAKRLGWPFQEGDELHPPSNIEKMRAGRPLTDDDRRLWLTSVAAWVDSRLDAGENGIITCSALKRSYRDVINRRASGVVFVYLAGAKPTIALRLAARQAHFMPSSLLDSQFADLQEPQPDEPHMRVEIGPPPDVIAERISRELGLSDAAPRPGDTQAGMSRVDVRPVRRGELEQLLPMIAGYQRYYGVEPNVERNRRFFSRFLHPSDVGLLLGAWVNEGLAGFATLYWFFSSTKAADAVLMNDLFVREDARGAGIGRALIQGAIDEARRRGAAHLEWYTSPDNLTAQRLYDSLPGAKRTGWYSYEIDTEH